MPEPPKAGCTVRMETNQSGVFSRAVDRSRAARFSRAPSPAVGGQFTVRRCGRRRGAFQERTTVGLRWTCWVRVDVSRRSIVEPLELGQLIHDCPTDEP